MLNLISIWLHLHYIVSILFVHDARFFVPRHDESVTKIVLVAVVVVRLKSVPETRLDLYDRNVLDLGRDLFEEVLEGSSVEEFEDVELPLLNIVFLGLHHSVPGAEVLYKLGALDVVVVPAVDLHLLKELERSRVITSLAQLDNLVHSQMIREVVLGETAASLHVLQLEQLVRRVDGCQEHSRGELVRVTTKEVRVHGEDLHEVHDPTDDREDALEGHQFDSCHSMS
jgi:hypothetical protein